MAAPAEASKVLCLAPSWVGDSIFFLPAVDALRRRYPRAEFGLLARPGICALLKGGARFQALHALPSGGSRAARLGAAWTLRRERYDLAVVFPDSFSAALAAFLGGARQRLGRAGEGRSFLLSRGLALPPRRRETHVVEEYLDLARACGAEADAEQKIPRLAPTEEGLGERARLFREAGLGEGLLVGLCPSSAYGPAKEWPARHWAALAAELESRRYRVAFFCAPAERERLEPLAAAARLPLLSPGLPGLAACLQACQAVVANDSGPLHLAAAVGARCLGLYGPVDPRWSGPRGPRSEALSLGLGCSPCHARTCPLKHHDCLEQLGVGRVLDAFQELLKR